MREDFVGAVGLNKIARFRLDPRDTRSDDDFYELIGDDDGVFGCMSLLGCHDVCPKQLPLSSQIAFLRRKMVALVWKRVARVGHHRARGKRGRFFAVAGHAFRPAHLR